MTALLERVARVISAADGDDPDLVWKGKAAWTVWDEAARAAIREVLLCIRRPTPAMIEAGYVPPDHDFDEALPGWGAMIDAFADEHGIPLGPHEAGDQP